MKLRVSVLLIALLLGGCAAAPYRPVIDTGVSRGNYDADLEDCQQLAAQRPVAANAGGGAAVGLRGNDVARVAAWGAANGGVNGVAYGVAEQREIIARCMAGRGYNVVAE